MWRYARFTFFFFSYFFFLVVVVVGYAAVPSPMAVLVAVAAAVVMVVVGNQLFCFPWRCVGLFPLYLFSFGFFFSLRHGGVGVVRALSDLIYESL